MEMVPLIKIYINDLFEVKKDNRDALVSEILVHLQELIKVKD